MLGTGVVGALLIICGIVYLAGAAIYQGRMSDPERDPADTPAHGLEPRGRGMRFLGLKTNWPGLALVVVGAILLLLPPLLAGGG
jgi:hypothetical protein